MTAFAARGSPAAALVLVRFDNAVAFGVGFCFPTSTYIAMAEMPRHSDKEHAEDRVARDRKQSSSRAIVFPALAGRPR